ncbi:hypothetical protein [Geoalkalibacter halelectricus]|uniref:hypothetical protein n=1 Tax=Geoalkalibacter halelectricus TaxID=2847045 RepID=UPI00266F7AD1|nr:hypothetical protein [Geoalkalibacter halelectricus]
MFETKPSLWVKNGRVCAVEYEFNVPGKKLQGAGRFSDDDFGNEKTGVQFL